MEIMAFMALVTGLITLISTSSVNAHNNELQQDVQQHDFDILEANQEWNKPVNVMERGLAAGVNPNAIAMGISGQSSGVLGGSSSAMAHSIPFDIQGIMSNLMNNIAQKDVRSSDVVKNYADAKLASNQADWIPAKSQAEIANMQKDLELMQSKMDLNTEQGKLASEQANQIRTLLPYLEGKSFLEINQAFVNIKQTEADIKLKVAQAFETYKKAYLEAEQAETQTVEQLRIQSEIDKIAADIRLTNAQTNLTEDQIQSQAIERYYKTTAAYKNMVDAQREQLDIVWMKNFGYLPSGNSVQTSILNSNSAWFSKKHDLISSDFNFDSFYSEVSKILMSGRKSSVGNSSDNSSD